MNEVDEIANLVNGYWKWMKDKTILKSVKDGWVEINTPFLDRHNDGIQVFARRKGDIIEVTDDGYTLDDLEMNGFSIDSPKRKSLLDRILNINDVSLRDNALVMEIPASDFASRKNDMISAIQQINDLHVMSKSNVMSLFMDDVAMWFEKKELYPSPNIRVPGSSGVYFKIDFLFQRNRTMPERMVQTVNRPNNQSVAGVILLGDELRYRNAEVVMIMNDENVSEKAIEKYTKLGKAHGVKSMAWSQRESDIGSIFAHQPSCDQVA